MKPISFSYADYAKLQTEMEHKNEYVNALITENARLQSENISLRAERDALLKSTMKVSEKIETIQPRGLLE